MKITKGLLVAFSKSTNAIGHEFPAGHLLIVTKTNAQKTSFNTFDPIDENKEVSLVASTKHVATHFRIANAEEIHTYTQKNNLDFKVKKDDIFEVQKDLVLSKAVTIYANSTIIVKKGGVNPIFSAKTGSSQYVDFNLPTKSYSDLKKHSGHLESELANWSLGKVKKNEVASQETLCFTAELLFQGKAVAMLQNDGWGGSHSFYPTDAKSAPMLKELSKNLNDLLDNKSISRADSLYKSDEMLNEAFVDYLLENNHAYSSFADSIKSDLAFFSSSNKKSSPKM